MLHIFDDEWNEKQQIVKSRLRHILKCKFKRIYARKCEIKELSTEDKDKFLTKYHLNGKDRSSVRYGLFYKKHLVSVMTFVHSRFDKNYQWEISRYASIFNFVIVGGMSKLISHFEKHQHPESLVAYVDRRWGDGEVFKQIGFNFIRNTRPSFFYTKHGIRFTRHTFMKHRLNDILDIFDENKSEEQNMKDNDYYRIYDCGNVVYTKTYTTSDTTASDTSTL